MSLVKFSKFGDFKISVSPIDDVYTYNMQAGFGLCPWKTFSDMNCIEGTDLVPFVMQTALNQTTKVATMTNGSYLAVKVTQKETNWTDYGSSVAYRVRQHRAKLYIYDKNNNLIFSYGSESTADILTNEYQIKATGNIVQGKCLLFIAEDVENKVAYAKVYGEGISTDKGTVPNILASYFIVNSSASLYNAIHGFITEYDPDPWANAGYAGIGGGEGTFDFESDTIGLPPIPSVDSVSSGFLQLFSGGLSKVLELSRYMWSTDFFDNIVKLTSNPIDIIMGLYMYPFVVPATSQKYVRAGNVITNIVMNVPDSQIFEIDCGVFPVPQFYGAYLDYEPFSKCEIYLPYCGTFSLSMDDISGKELNVRYRVDLLTGLCVAYVIIDGTVKYNFTGSCAVNIPISSRSFENLYNSIMGLVGGMFNEGKYTASSVGSISGVVMSGKNQITHGGIASGNAGYLGVQKPYLIFNVPRVAIPKGLNKYTGYPIFATYRLGDLEGYTEIEEIHLENMGTATKEEIDRIVSLLKGGVIL